MTPIQDDPQGSLGGTPSLTPVSASIIARNPSDPLITGSIRAKIEKQSKVKNVPLNYNKIKKPYTKNNPWSYQGHTDNV